MKRWPWLATLLALAGLSACTAAPSAPPTAAPTPAQASAPSVAFVSFSAGYDSGSVPPPFNYTYALDGTFGADALDVHYVLIYRYRDQVTLKEITSQGYTTHDDIDWTGRLTGATLDTWRSLVGGTTLGPIPPLVPGAEFVQRDAYPAERCAPGWRAHESRRVAVQHRGDRQTGPRRDRCHAVLAVMRPQELPQRPPFTVRARVLTPLASGGTRDLTDGLLAVDRTGRIERVEAWPTDAQAGEAVAGESGPVVDLRPMVLMPGLVDLHLHLPQFPSAGLGAGLDLLTWLQRHIFPLERAFDAAAAADLAPRVFQALAAAGTTTVLAYGAIWAESLDACFEAAEAHGVRAILGKVMMDRLTYDENLPADRILSLSLRQSRDLAERWNGRDGGRLHYAVTPRFAVSCTEEMLRESAALAKATGSYWQTHLSEDRGEIATVARLFPDARDYLDVYDRAGALGPRTIMAHAIHLSDRELDRIVQTGTRIAHCPSSNLFLASGAMPLARYLERGAIVGLGSDVAAAPDASLFTQMRTGFYVQNALRVMRDDHLPILDPAGWLRMATLDGARVLGLDGAIGSLETGKEADLIAVDPSMTLPVAGMANDVDVDALLSRLIFRSHPEMVRGAWVRGRLLDAAGPVAVGAA